MISSGVEWTFLFGMIDGAVPFVGGVHSHCIIALDKGTKVDSSLSLEYGGCHSLSSLDLSHFYYWTEDLPPALEAHPSVAASLSRLDLHTLLSAKGFKSHKHFAITASCPNLRELLAACMFNPRYIHFIGDEALLALASNCHRLSLLHLVDISSLANARADLDDDGFTSEDARISRATLEDLLEGLPLLEELVLDVCHNISDTGWALEILNSKCPLLKLLKLGQFHGICRPTGSQLDGIALCKGLTALSIKNSADLTDSGLMALLWMSQAGKV
ncbi:hypothetical protein HHK36_005124 [Tetracentron sinense]|uniref:Uncharacterized protein n=1 Tax=Tetracentron sinense TaxID=13715 RepID=A0A835DQT8_TETSI|nr:hypothetical protein HHK36_005124 [Tetracentron sinense]